jgi:hypothetical protein
MGRGANSMRKAICTLAMALALIASGSLTERAAADGVPVVRHKRVHHVCCGPYAPCGRCNVGCPDRYSCYPLYGAYGPYGGIGYWGGFTFAGWGRRW